MHDPDLSFALEAVRQLAATKGKRFAVIADEAHIMGSLDTHTSMSTQALNSTAVQDGILDILLNCSRLYETLRERAAA